MYNFFCLCRALFHIDISSSSWRIICPNIVFSPGEYLFGWLTRSLFPYVGGLEGGERLATFCVPCQFHKSMFHPCASENWKGVCWECIWGNGAANNRIGKKDEWKRKDDAQEEKWREIKLKGLAETVLTSEMSVFQLAGHLTPTQQMSPKTLSS